MSNQILSNNLNSFVKDELFTVLENFDIKLKKSSVKKELLENIINVYEQKYKLFLEILPKHSLDFISEYSVENNKISEEIFFESEEFIMPLQSFGFISKNPTKIKKEVFFEISPWFLEKILPLLSEEEVQSTLKFYQNLETLAFGYIKYFGALSEENLFEFVSKEISNLTFEQMINILNKRWLFNLLITKQTNPTSNNTYFVADGVYDSTLLIENIEANSHIEYKEISKETCENYSQYFYAEDSPSVKSLFEILTALDFDPTETGFNMLMIINKIKNQIDPNEIIKDFIEANTIYSKEINEVIYSLANELPIWTLKGNTRTELDISLDDPTKQRVSIKIPRNEPCPCGSGKKYKKCCGK